MINDSGSEAENDKKDHIIDTIKIDLGLNMDTNIHNIKCTSV